MEQEVPNELLLVLDDGDVDFKESIPESEVMPSRPRSKGAYYKNIERKMLLKKKRVNVCVSTLLLHLHPPFLRCSSSSRMTRSRRSGT